VDGRDRGGVKVDDGTLQPIETVATVLRNNKGEKLVIVLDDRRVAQGGYGLSEAGAYAVAQLGRRSPCKRDDQELLDGIAASAT